MLDKRIRKGSDLVTDWVHDFPTCILTRRSGRPPSDVFRPRKNIPMDLFDGEKTRTKERNDISPVTMRRKGLYDTRGSSRGPSLVVDEHYLV